VKIKLSAIASAAALLAVAAAPHAASAATNFALSSMGASFVSGSSVIPQGTFGLTMNYTVMQANLITNTPSPSINNGDTRYIFDHYDPNATIEINLGQVRQIDTLGAIVTLVVDRPVVGPFSAEVSTDGSNFFNFGTPEVITGSTTNPLQLTDTLQGVQYVRYHFGYSPDYYGGGGIGINQVLAEGPSGVPEPAEWALLVVGIGAMGAVVRGSRRAKAVAA
jgi:hypothetical protein